MLYLSINIDIFIVYCYLKFLSNFISKILYSLNILFRKSSYIYIDKNNIVLLYKLLIVIEFLI